MLEDIEAYLRYLLEQQEFAPNTVMAYQNDLSQFYQYLQEAQTRYSPAGSDDASSQTSGESKSVDWTQIDIARLTGYVVSLRDRGYAPSTVARKIAAVKSFFRYMVVQGKLATDPAAALELPHLGRGEPKVLLPEEVEALLAVPARDTGPAAQRDRAMLELLYATGLRVSELVALNLDDVSVATSYARCVGRRGRERLLPLNPRVVKTLDTYLRDGRPRLARPGDEQALFLNQRGERLTRQGFWLLMRDYTRRAGISSDVTPHSLRHSFAAHTLAGGADIRSLQELLGHASSSTTQMYSRFSGHQPQEEV
jgi:integrase/recombinase XerD